MAGTATSELRLPLGSLQLDFKDRERQCQRWAMMAAPASRIPGRAATCRSCVTSAAPVTIRVPRLEASAQFAIRVMDVRAGRSCQAADEAYDD